MFADISEVLAASIIRVMITLIMEACCLEGLFFFFLMNLISA
jgi:hypothetical protein